MTIPQDVLAILGWRNQKPNIADSASATSVAVGAALFEALGVERVSTEPGQTLGALFEAAVQDLLAAELPALAPDRVWDVS